MTKKTETHVAKVIRHGEALVIPDSMTARQALGVIQRQVEYEEQDFQLHERFDAFLWDGAYALQKALGKKFGWVGMQTVITEGFFGKQEDPPTMVGVAISHNEIVQVPWGRMRVPGIEGYLETGLERTNEGRLCFVLQGVIKRKHERQVNEIVELVRGFLKTDSIYRGKPVRIRFMGPDPRGSGKLVPLLMPEPKFMDLSGVKEHELIYSESVARAIEASLFTPIERAEDCRRMGVPLKRGILLAGPYGVGKTLAAYVAAFKAEKAKWTFVYCETAPELQDAIRFAQQYAPAVVFCEDIDRVATGERDVTMDSLLAIVDGIESKETELLVVLTTNEPEKIHQAMLRPGRLDSIINVTPPDPGAVVKLVQLYARGLVADGQDLAPVGDRLQGQIPAVIRECVERSKLHALRLSVPGEDVKITAAALLGAADEMEFALHLLETKKPDDRSDIEKAAATLVEGLAKNHAGVLEEMPTLR